MSPLDKARTGLTELARQVRTDMEAAESRAAGGIEPGADEG